MSCYLVFCSDNMSKEHYWVCGRVDQYVNGFYRDDEPEKMILMPARWETTVGLLNGTLQTDW